MAQTRKATTQANRSFEPETRLPLSAGFEDFFRSSFRQLVKIAMYAGATETEAEDAAANTLMEMFPNWESIQFPLTYARRAVLHNFIKDRTRGPNRVSRRLVERGWVTREDGVEDDQLTAWEDREWVSQQLHLLPAAQREVMEFIVGGLTPAEIAEVLGKTKEAIRRNLCDARKRLALKLRQEHGQHAVPLSPREEGS